MGVYLKSTVHCINGARSKLLGPDVLLHVNTEVLAKKREQTFFLELIMYISSNSNHPWKTLWSQSPSFWRIVLDFLH